MKKKYEKKGEINNNVHGSNTLRSSNSSSPNTCSFNTWSRILKILIDFVWFNSTLIGSISC